MNWLVYGAIAAFAFLCMIPLIYSEAGKSKTISPGMALTAVSSIGFLGFLAGPPVIGLLAGAATLRLSFLVIGFIGLLIAGLIHFRR